MATFFVTVLVVVAVINYILVLSNLKSCTEDNPDKIWPRLLRLFLTIGVTLIAFTYCFVAYFLWLLPTFHKALSIDGLFHAVVFIYVWFNIVFNYFAVILTSPGKAYSLTQLEEEGYATENVSICKKCKRLKSLGTGHCSPCGYCVRLHSHHSYLLNNCIGLNNFSYYYLLLCFACFGEAFCIYELYRPFTVCVIGRGQIGLTLDQCSNIGGIASTFFLLVAGFLANFFTLLFHTLLLRVDKSQKEFLTEMKSSSSYFKYLMRFTTNIFRRRVNRHRLQHMISERKPAWKDIFLPSLNEPPIDLAAEDYIDYDTEAEYMI